MKTYKETNEELYLNFINGDYSKFKFQFDQLSPNGVLLFIEYLQDNDDDWTMMLHRITVEAFK